MSQRPLDLLISIRMTGDSAVTVEIRLLHQQLGKGTRADSSWCNGDILGSETDLGDQNQYPEQSIGLVVRAG